MTTQTQREPGGGGAASRAATLAALDGSQKTPSASASSRHAARIASSVSVTTSTPWRATATSTSCWWKGSAMRIALATVEPRSAAWAATICGMPAPHSSKPLT